MSDKIVESYLNKDVTTGAMAEITSLRYLTRFATPWKWSFIGAFILLASASVLMMCSAYFLGLLVDKGLLSSNNDLITRYAILLLVCEVVAVFTMYAGRRLLARSASFALYLSLIHI